MTSPTPQKPDPKYKRPHVDWESRAYWEGAGRGELVLQRCRACGVVQHRPRGLCGLATVYTFSIVRQNQMPEFREAVPYVIAYVQTDEGPQLLTNIVGCAPEAVSIGLRVRVDFVPVEADARAGTPIDAPLAVPRFVPA
jgi:uncharacterized OB-fold protein